MKELDDYSSATTTEAEASLNSSARRFEATVAAAVSFGLVSLLLNSLLALLPWPLSLGLSVLLMHFIREWFRIHGAALTRQQKVFVNWTDTLKDPTFIPSYELKWLFPSRYNPMVVNCCGEDELTADDPGAISPKETSAGRI